VFLSTNAPSNLDVENNYIENVRTGLVVLGSSDTQTTKPVIVVRSNRVRNVNGQRSNGKGGYLTGKSADRVPARFLELDQVQADPNVEVGWNEVINYPEESAVSEVIRIFRSGGTANNPLDIHDTYIQGAYPTRPADAYFGGGITTAGETGDTAQTSSAFSFIHDNQVVGTVGYGIAFVAGHDNVAANNRVISSGRLPDGTRIAAQHVGLINADTQSSGGAGDYNNTMRDNVVGWNCWASECAQRGYRWDQYFPASPQDYSNNSVVPASITQATEDGEYLVWSGKVASSGIKVGPSF
jgi:hypothetical protein